MSTSHGPTLIFVHGSWHRPSTWDKLTSILQPKGHKCISVSLPSSNSDDPSSSLKDDIDAIRASILQETTQGRDVVVVVHSFGSIPGGSSFKGLTRPKNHTDTDTVDTNGHVIGMVLMATGFAESGRAFMDATGGQPPPFWIADKETGFAVLTADVRPLFYHDLPREEADLWVSRLGQQSLKSLFEGGEHVYSGWKDVPCWYLATTEDKALPVEAQRYFVQLAKDAGGDVTMREVASSHSPMLSRPEETAKFLEETIKAFTA